MNVSNVSTQRPHSSFESEQVLAALQRILSSDGFIASDRHRQFLSYVVKETLSGRAERLKGYTIAIQVFGRDASFDAQTDPLVRIEARRLRRALEHYYLTTGKSDPVRISVPKGGYVPVFEKVAEAAPLSMPPAAPEDPREGKPAARHRWMLAALAVTLATALALIATLYAVDKNRANGDASEETAAIGPTLLIEPISTISGGAQETALARGLSEELVTALSRFKAIRVALGTPSEPPSGSASRRALDSGHALRPYRVRGSVRTIDRVTRIMVNLEDGLSGTILWTRTFDVQTEQRTAGDIETEVASKVAETLGDPYDVLFSNELKRVRAVRSTDSDAYACVLSFYAYWQVPTASEHRVLRDCTERAVRTTPLYADAWTNLAWIYLDEYRFGYDPSDAPPSALERASSSARQALTLEPDNARAHMTMAVVQWFNHDLRLFTLHAEIALALNDCDIMIAAELGLRFALSGQWERAEPLIARAVAREPPKWQIYRIAYALRAVEAGDYVTALDEVRKTRISNQAVIQVLRASIYGQLGRISEAREEWRGVMRDLPDVAESPRAWLARRNLSPALTCHLMEGLAKAGLLEGG